MGEVIHGRRIGRTIGMPTANLMTPENKLLPPNGVYISRTRIYNKEYPSVTNIGCNPTVSDSSSRRIETYVYEFTGDLYGKDIEVMLYHYQRPEMKFESIDALKAQMHRDKDCAVAYFKK